MKTLIYPGAGWDNEFLPIFKERGYDTFILYDALPELKHYSPTCAGWKKQESFFQTLQASFGHFQRQDNNALTFTQNNITYHYSTNVESLEQIPDGDVFLRGYIPETWKGKGFFNGRKTYFSADMLWDKYVPDEAEMIHLAECICDECCESDKSDE